MSSSSSRSTEDGTHQYWSVDSAPAKLTRPLSIWAAPAVLIIFTGVSSLLLLAINKVPFLAEAFPNRDIVFSPYFGTHSVPLRIFILSFYLAFAAVVGAGAGARVKFLAELIFTYVLICGAFDLCNIIVYRTAGLIYSIDVVEILSGLIGFFVFSLKLLDHGSMPEKQKVPPRKLPLRLSWLPLFAAVLGAMWLSITVDEMHVPLIEELRGIALLGGTGPGVFLFLPALFFILYAWGTAKSVLNPPRPFSPPVTVIVPAHNEAHVITRTLSAIDAAAAQYEGTVKIIVLDNNSTDTTAAVAAEAFLGLKHLSGRVVSVPTPGKAIALNRGVQEVDTEYLIRIDADTQVLPNAIVRAMKHFADPVVGIVGGMPIPPGTGPFDRARLLEVLLKHGYYQVAYGAVDCIVGVPGMFAAYRTDAVRGAGGFVQGMNGEDTDVSLRIGEMGYRIIGDPMVQYISEVPVTYKHMREQRMRWFRSVYHVSARNRTYLDGWGASLRGKVVLPFMLLNSARRAMTLPLLIFGALNLLFDVDPTSPLTGQAVMAVLIGAPALMGVIAVLMHGRFRALLYLPEYVAFRMLRSYFTLESVLSIAFAQGRQSS
jgi:glycosyltransferase involved in cell wall biosynthesis